MEWSSFFELSGKILWAITAVIGGWWAFVKWRKRDEHFPRVSFEVTAQFIEKQSGMVITEVVATLEKRGVVPLKIKSFEFKLRGIKSSDKLILGSEKIRGQLLFPHVVSEGPLVPENWNYSFVYPQVKTEYKYVTMIPGDMAFVRVEANFAYLQRGETHHAAKILRLPQTIA